MTSKKWIGLCLGVFLALLVLPAALTAVIDPFFHYHAPLEGVSYIIDDERYQNDGIMRHFDYDAVITGTSMTEYFKTSEFDQLFGVKSVKVPYSGGGFLEQTKNLERGFASRPEIRYVVRSIEPLSMGMGKDEIQTDAYPGYLYDDALCNDVNYLLNKEVLLGHTMEDLAWTLYGNETTSFDEYANWSRIHTFSKEAVLAGFQRAEVADEPVVFSQEEKEELGGNLEQNIVALAQSHPETEFYYFFAPYSILWWDTAIREGRFGYELERMAFVAEKLLACSNIRLFSFSDDYDLVTDLDRYRDYAHYDEDANSAMLRRMRDGEYELTLENYKERLEGMRAFYAAYDYDGIYS